MSKPTIILIPGAWHSPAMAYTSVISLLQAQSYPSITIKTATVGAEPPTKTIADDVQAIHSIMLPLLDEGKEVILVAHSYGGIPATICTKDHGIEERRKEGKRGGIKAVVFITALLILERGINVFETFGSAWPEWMIEKGGYAFLGPTAEDAFYNDVPKNTSSALMKQLSHHCIGALYERPEFVAADLRVPSAYLVCKGDHAVPPVLQEMFVGCLEGVRRFECESGHSPTLTMPEVVVEVIVEVDGGL